MYSCKKPLLLVGAVFTHLWAISQNNVVRASGADDGLMRSEGKIYVVMAVAIIILVALLYYLLRLDRKITRLEKGESV